MAPALSARTNLLLSGLSRRERERVLADCESVDLVAGTVLCEKGERIRHAWFPTDSFISLLTPGERHANFEVAMVGSEGMVGTSLLLDVDVAPLHARVQGSGPCLRISAANLKRHLAPGSALRKRLNRYAYVFTSQLAQGAACNRYHFVENRLARWLLMTQDRAHRESFQVTQELVSYLLGVRRVGVTKAAGSLQRLNLITYSRGQIMVVDRHGLEAAACPCYSRDNATYHNMLG